MGLEEKISVGASGIFLYGLTPPKLQTPPLKLKGLVDKQIKRMKALNVDGLILYDIHDEKDRTGSERTFPFLETIDPHLYSKDHLTALDLPRIVYRCVGKYGKDDFSSWLKDGDKRDHHSVFVGAASGRQQTQLKLDQAYDLYNKWGGGLSLGGVCIPERHALKKDEHLRLVAKQGKGCKFFVSQAVFNVENAKNFLSDYYYYCKDHAIAMVPIVLTLSPCGSKKTMDFLKWLGIHISKWLENDIMNACNPVMQSVDVLTETFKDLWHFSKGKNIPIGCNIESISTSKIEIDASVVLAERIRKIMDSL